MFMCCCGLLQLWCLPYGLQVSSPYFQEAPKSQHPTADISMSLCSQMSARAVGSQGVVRPAVCQQQLTAHTRSCADVASQKQHPLDPQPAKKRAELHMQECGAVVSAQLTCVPEVASMVSLDRAVAPAIAGMMQLETPLQDLFAIARPCAGQTRDQTVMECYCSCCMLVLSHVQPDQGSNAL